MGTGAPRGWITSQHTKITESQFLITPNWFSNPQLTQFARNCDNLSSALMALQVSTNLPEQVTIKFSQNPLNLFLFDFLYEIMNIFAI